MSDDPDRDKLIRELAASRAEWQALVESAPDLILQLAHDGTIRFINRTTIGIPRERVIGTNWLAALDGENRARLEQALASVVATGEPTTVEAAAVPRDGRRPWYSCHLGPIRHDGSITGVILIARDITQRKEAEHQLLIADRMASVGTLAAGVAHEINNPLAAVIANLHLALRSDAAGQDRRLEAQLKDAAHASERVREIVSDLKMFSRVEEERRVQVDVQEVIESTLRMAGNEIRHRARLVRDFAAVPPVLANEARLGQVVLNLVVNAVQAIPEGDSSRHEIRASTRTGPDGRVVIAIADTGAGIPEEIRDRLFTPFFTTKPVGVGTGLGLPICHRIVSALGGEIQFTSEVGRGTEFRVLLPPAPPQQPGPAVPEPAVATPPRRGRVLVIDDEPLITRTVKRLLGADHDVVEVTGGEPALALILAGERFDVILCDLMMPAMSGMDLHAELVKCAPDQAGRLVFMTGGAFTPRAAAFLASTSNRHLDKPFDIAGLRRVVDGLMS